MTVGIQIIDVIDNTELITQLDTIISGIPMPTPPIPAIKPLKK